jgi:hypothetical protein
MERIYGHLMEVAAFLEALERKTGRYFHLGLEPEPLGLFENVAETVEFIGRLREAYGADERLSRYIGINYDCCHMAIEYEDARAAMDTFLAEGILVSKAHLSSGLKLVANRENRDRLKSFRDDVYLHQVIARRHEASPLQRHADLPAALETDGGETSDEEWRVHFHIPLHAEPGGALEPTCDHVRDLLDIASEDPGFCRHFEIETYTWEVLPHELKQRRVEEQIHAEYRWVLEQMRVRRMV